jgi:hypothetical protein
VLPEVSQMTNDISNPLNLLTPMTLQEKLLGPTGEKSPIKGKGTIRWKIEDDNGMVHTIKLKNALYVLAFKTCLLSTQHWSQSMNDHFLT